MVEDEESAPSSRMSDSTQTRTRTKFRTPFILRLLFSLCQFAAVSLLLKKSDSQFKSCHLLDTRKKCNSNFSDSNLETLNLIPAKLHCQEKRENGSGELAMFSAKSLSFLLSQTAEHKSRMNSL